MCSLGGEKIQVNTMKKDISKKTGFTVIELLVASAIFSIFLAVAVGSFTRILQVQRVLARRIIMTSALGATIESMSREIRVGIEFPTDKINEESSLLDFESFSTHDVNPIDVTFSINGGVITRNGVQITPSDLVIKSGKFIINQKDCGPWRITLVLSAHPKDIDKPEDTINVQTTITSRVLPIDVKGDPHQCKSI